jgi:tight adherence protein B
MASPADLQRIRRKRSLSGQGNYVLDIFSINKLLLQSGMTLGWAGFFTAIFGAAASAIGISILAGFEWPLALALALGASIGLPAITLRALRARRQARFEELLPDAIDTLVRSLRAGHALPAAIAAVAANAPEPIQGEFRLASAEMLYGLDIETALLNMQARVGQPDLGLIVLAVSLQSKTGGNLAELLASLSKTIRSRLKLRRKAYALTSEARFSAIVLTLLPFVLFCAIRFFSPNFYGDVWSSPYVKPILIGAVLWMALGDLIMFRMVRIKV